MKINHEEKNGWVGMWLVSELCAFPGFNAIPPFQEGPTIGADGVANVEAKVVGLPLLKMNGQGGIGSVNVMDEEFYVC